MIDLKGKKVGLVLSGGGAKGIYQVGMLRALEEHGLEKKDLVMTGTSIGAMNALLYACGESSLPERIHSGNGKRIFSIHGYSS